MKEIESKHERQVDELRSAKDSIQRAHDKLAADLQRTEEQLAKEKDETARLKATISSQSAAFLTLEGDHSALKAKLQRTEETLAARETTIEQLQNEVKDNKALIAALEQKIREEESMRRRLHNTIQELKGNIRVFCRVRPPMGAELAKGKSVEESMSHMKLPTGMDGKEIELFQTTESADGSKSVVKSYPFTFDNVFPVHVRQEQVFEEISQLVQSALDGYPVCIFAYGQTGSGKTYTMEGPNNPDSTSMGMIPRAVQQIFATAEQLKEKGWVYTMEGQFVEIYNESIHDLLGNGDLSKKHDIKHLAGNKTIITDVKTVVLDTPEKMTSLLKTAGQNRAVGATLCNERSSRSHSVFTLRLSGRNTATEEVSDGVLNLIDLAGSERLAQSGATGERLKETQAINKSLASLGDVIAALSSNKDGHIPYRNSKLTYLLQNSLGGNSKTLMFVNISPSPESFQETLCSLRFATKVNACHIGTARRVAK
ncbi:C-terminal kinesin [Syncephalis pseudoplumigaleata]|uniref:Kinesin-like protein n=1 Tax=Syncephalis pseudoplumigaleata TaxID=1712513 RepID=A0A4P9Z5J4_9FUNG|nr:C-terminal kinesin [Syncephalis pseudoplumigaleata]|eukprot:RKP27728.1 C-terminal kinesin [Syncephalis pseudoplumigaleata]